MEKVTIEPHAVISIVRVGVVELLENFQFSEAGLMPETIRIRYF
jgi:hypothetical protein